MDTYDYDEYETYRRPVRPGRPVGGGGGGGGGGPLYWWEWLLLILLLSIIPIGMIIYCIVKRHRRRMLEEQDTAAASNVVITSYRPGDGEANTEKYSGNGPLPCPHWGPNFPPAGGPCSVCVQPSPGGGMNYNANVDDAPPPYEQIGPSPVFRRLYSKEHRHAGAD